MDLTLGAPLFLDPGAYKTPAPEIQAMVARFCKGRRGGVHCTRIQRLLPRACSSCSSTCCPIPWAWTAARARLRSAWPQGSSKGCAQSSIFQDVAGYRQAHNYPVRLFIGDIKSALSPQGTLANPQVAERLGKQCAGFMNYVVSSKSPAKAADA